MEFTIDFTMVRKITAQEYEQARVDIGSFGVVQANRRSLERHDERLAQAGDAHTLACKAGCSWCCYFSVDVRAAEVFSIMEFMEWELSAQEKERIGNEIAANSLLLKSLSELERMQRNIKCPFLNSGRCTIYAARPQTCRNYHATNAAGCQKSYEEPGNFDIDPEYAPLVYQAGGAHVDAFSKAMLDAGYDITVYELSTALAAAFEDASSRERFEAKKSPFITLQGTHVPMEFMGLEFMSPDD